MCVGWRCVRLCDERMRRSELAEVPTLTRLQPNNVLLSDPHYSRVFRAWKWLRDDEEALRQSWNDALQRTRVLLCWMVAAQLVTRERVVVAERWAASSRDAATKHHLGVEVLGAETVGSDWFLNPPLHFLVLPSGHNDAAFRIRLSLEEFILAHVASLGGRGSLVEESVSALAFRSAAHLGTAPASAGDRHRDRRLETSLRGADRAFADLAGLTPLATQMARQILQRCSVNPNVERRAPAAITPGRRWARHRAWHRIPARQRGSRACHCCCRRRGPWRSMPGEAGGVDWIGDARTESWSSALPVDRCEPPATSWTRASRPTQGCSPWRRTAAGEPRVRTSGADRCAGRLRRPRCRR